MTEHALYYTDALIEKLQLRWGDGFLSPGGENELAQMLGDFSVAGASVLDLGCGVGGYDTLLVKAHGARKVTGIDIDAASLELARRNASLAVVGSQLEFRHVVPGPLPFENAAFDVVFSKDTIVDLPDKRTALSELYRVLKPGGSIVLSDWFRSNGPMTAEMRAWTSEGDETYDMATIAGTAEELIRAGFTNIVTDDRNEWFKEFARDEYERLKGPLFEVFVERFGRDDAEQSVENARIRALLADQGQLRPGHIRAVKPK
ncbi:MAG: methyltransferase domain-containing protein [Pseudomonadota bacterium]